MLHVTRYMIVLMVVMNMIVSVMVGTVTMVTALKSIRDVMESPSAVMDLMRMIVLSVVMMSSCVIEIRTASTETKSVTKILTVGMEVMKGIALIEKEAKFAGQKGKHLIIV